MNDDVFDDWRDALQDRIESCAMLIKHFSELAQRVRNEAPGSSEFLFNGEQSVMVLLYRLEASERELADYIRKLRGQITKKRGK